MYTKSTHGPETHSASFYNAWVVAISFLIGICVILAAVLAGWPVFFHLITRITG